MISSGRALEALVTGVPHEGQNPRVIVLPESAVDTKVCRSPVSETSAALKIAFTVDEPAAKYWQSRHQHWRVAIGVELTEYRTDLHRQPPVMARAMSAAMSVLQPLS